MSAGTAAAGSDADLSELARNLQRFLETYYHEDIAGMVADYPDTRSVTVEWADLEEYDAETAAKILDYPDRHLNDYFPEALRTYDQDGVTVNEVLEEYGVHVRLAGLPETATFAPGEERAKQVGHLIAIRGQVTKRSSVQPDITEAAFECRRCGTFTYVPQPYTTLIEPFQCQGCEKGGSFHLNYRQSEMEDHQKLRVQQRAEDMTDDQTEFIDVHAYDDLCGRAEGGQDVVVVGELIAVPSERGSTVQDTFLNANNVIPEDSDDAVDLDEYQDLIEDLRAADDTFERLAASIAPTHIGDDHIREAILFALVRGNSPGDHNGFIHIGLFGDPGTGKTDFIKAVVKISPRSIRADGSLSSGPGLSAAITRDSWTDEEFTVTAGAYPSATGGICAIDEFDKADPTDLKTLYEAMEDGTVRISKAGLRAKMQADTCLLAAANPTGGHIDDDKSFYEQMDLDSPLLTRFTLIFVPREHDDREIIEDIAEGIVRSRDAETKLEQGIDVPDHVLEQIEPALSVDEMRAAVKYARSLTPVIKDQAVADALRDWYVELKCRLTAREEDEERDIPVTPRKQHAVAKLAEASAKAHFREEITMADVDEAVQKLGRSLQDIGIAEGLDIDVGPDAGGLGTSPSEVVRTLVDDLKFAGTEYGAQRETVIQRAVEDGLSRPVVEETIDAFLDDGKLAETEGRLVPA